MATQSSIRLNAYLQVDMIHDGPSSISEMKKWREQKHDEDKF